MSKAKTPLIGILAFRTSEDSEHIYLSASCVLTMQGSSKPLDTDKIRIDIPVRENAAEISFAERYGRRLPRGFRLNSFVLSIRKEDVADFDIQNKLIVRYEGADNGRILYSMRDLKKGRNKNSRIFIRDGMAMYFRQNKHNSLTFTVRDANIYDYPEGQERIEQAYRKAMARRTKRLATGVAGRDRSQEPVFMYEKNCARYEESASVLYEKLIDAGYDNVYYIVDAGNPAVQDLPEKYRKNLVDKDSDRHLELFFECDKFISSETIDHALQLRIANKRVLDKLEDRELMYVFLQHGVMYMISLNSELRIGFRQKKCRLHRTVVSSQAEADHFIELGGMKQEDLYVTGLAKFDKCFRKPDADRIVIMPTWRRWETNLARRDLTETGYYRMIDRMYNAVPEELRDRTVILPHPLMKDRFAGTGEAGSHILIADSYDKVLQECELLITDYSSIAYDAFYRGANVIFCWEDKDECMSHYGPETHLMLNMDNVFGDVCMNVPGAGAELTAAIERNYGHAQDKKYIGRYNRIVEFHDGRNSERIMRLLERDGMLIKH